MEYLIYFQILTKKYLFDSGKRKKKKWNEELIKSQQWTNKFYDVLCKRLFSYIMSKTSKTLGTALMQPLHILIIIVVVKLKLSDEYKLINMATCRWINTFIILFIDDNYYWASNTLVILSISCNIWFPRYNYYVLLMSTFCDLYVTFCDLFSRKIT